MHRPAKKRRPRRADLAKIAGTHGIAGHAGGVGAHVAGAHTLVVEEKESLVLDDGSPNGGAEVVPVNRRNGNDRCGAIVEPVIGVGDGVADEVVERCHEKYWCQNG